MFDNEIIERQLIKTQSQHPTKITDATYITLYCIYIIEPQKWGNKKYHKN